jgi:hypothetical protein
MVEILKAAILFIIVLEPNHYLHKDEQALQLLANSYIEASNKYDVDPFLIISNTFFESSFKPNVVGRAGEVGLAQVHGEAHTLCSQQGYNPVTVQGGVLCSAYLLRRGKNMCGSWLVSLVKYRSGQCLKHNEFYLRKARMRYRFAQRLRKKFVK